MKWHPKLKACPEPELLRPGQIIRNRGSGNTYQVLVEGKAPVVVRHLHLTNPLEWELVVPESR